MLVLIWAALLFCLTDGAGTVNEEKASWSITFAEKDITAQAGLCVVIPCSFTHASTFRPDTAIWFKCGSDKEKCSVPDRVQVGFTERVALLKTDIAMKNCSIIINDLTLTDTGLYQFRVVEIINGKKDGYTFTSKANISVGVLSQKPTVSYPPLTEGQQTTLTCTAPGLCSGTPPNITWTWTGTADNIAHITDNTTRITDTTIKYKTEILTSVTKSHSSTLTFTPSAEHHGTNITCQVTFVRNITTEKTVTLNVTHIKDPQISGNSILSEGDTLRLTCHAVGYPSPPPLSSIVWSRDGSTLLHQDNTVVFTHTVPPVTKAASGERHDVNNPSRDDSQLNDAGMTTVIIHNVTRQDAGEYSCTVKHLNKTRTTSLNVTVMSRPEILNGSGCLFQSEVLTCVCISQGFPLPTIEWPLLKNITEYSVTTHVVSSSAVNSTITMPVKDCSNTTVECVSRNEVSRESRKMTPTHKDAEEQRGELLGALLREWKTIAAFLIGATLSAVVCCCIRKCHRCKKKDPKSSRSAAETLEMVTSCEDQQVDAGHAAGDYQTPQREAPEGGDGSGAVQDSGTVGSSSPEVEPGEVDYASIDYSLLKENSPEEDKKKQETTGTDYAEIKRKKVQEVQADGGEESGMSKVEEEGEEEEKEVMIGEDERKESKTEEEVGEENALYSNVKAIMGEQG